VTSRKRRLGNVQLLRKALQLVLRDPSRIREHSQLITGEGLAREDVAHDVAVAIGHFKRL
jgi:hypothetical protein